MSAIAQDAELLDNVQDIFAMHLSLQAEAADRDVPVRVISYHGTASDKIGNNGDFYVDELCNILYGPKADGVWPEEGVHVTGPVVCKRTFIQMNAARWSTSRLRLEPEKESFFRNVYAYLVSRLFGRAWASFMVRRAS